MKLELVILDGLVQWAAIFVKRVNHQVELHLLVLDDPEAEPGLRNAKPGLQVLRHKLWKAETAFIVLWRLLLIDLGWGHQI